MIEQVEHRRKSCESTRTPVYRPYRVRVENGSTIESKGLEYSMRSIALYRCCREVSARKQRE
jgi:hypothetical protein